MSADQVIQQQHGGAGVSRNMGETGPVQAAIDQVAAAGSKFLRGEVDAGQMAETMVQTATDCMAQGHPADTGEARKLQEIMPEILGCGSGYLAGRCDADCVRRTVSVIVNEFATH